jgi:type IV pilus assembly protein PilC
MRLAYHAYDGNGREVNDVVEAASMADATEMLRRNGLFVAEINAAASENWGPAPAAGAKPIRVRSGLKQLAAFTRQLHVLVSSGIPLVDGMGALRRQIADPGWRAVVTDVRARVEEGKSLAAAMDSHPKSFDPIYRSLIAAGEASGTLPMMLERLGHLLQKRLHIRNTIIGAMVYPGLLLTIAMGVMVVLLVFVIPRFAVLFKSLGVPLPGTTQFLIVASDVVRTYWWAIPVILFVIVLGMRLYVKSAAGRRVIDGLILKLPQLGKLARSFILARIARVLGVLLEGRVTIVEAIDLTRQGAGNVCYADLLTRAQDAVIRGQTISSVFNSSDLVTPSITEAVRSGEQSGRLGFLLLQIADFLDEDNDIVLRSLTSIIEPIILVLLGLLVGAMALSLFTPLFDIAAIANGGG